MEEIHSKPSTPDDNRFRSAPSSILFQSSCGLYTLIDLPSSIALARGSFSETKRSNIVSCTPLAQPYPPTEPKTAAARRRLVSRQRQSSTRADTTAVKSDATKDESRDEQFPTSAAETFIRAGIAEISANYRGTWCLPRQTRSMTDEAQPDRASNTTVSPTEPSYSTLCATETPQVIHLSSSVPYLSSPNALDNKVFINPDSRPSQLAIRSPSQSNTYLIPPQCSFIPSLLSQGSSAFTSLALHCIDQYSADPGLFDLILLDPPWPNRSARRAGSYQQVRSHSDDAVCGIGEILPHHLASDGYIACWITHAAASRRAVEKLFEDCGVVLVEEWIWAKVTIDGDMSVPLGSLWRRGWEVLLVGKRAGDERAGCEIVRRLVAAVPDLHSRKPCLKQLFEMLLFGQDSSCRGRVLEVFARHLTEGWCALGNEVLRFNWEGHWVDSGNGKVS